MQILRAADREGNRLQEPDLLFGALSLGDISDDATVEMSSLGLPGCQRELEREFTSISTQPGQFHRPADEADRIGASHALDSGSLGLPIPFGHQHVNGMAHHFFTGPAEHGAGGLIAGDDGAAAVG